MEDVTPSATYSDESKALEKREEEAYEAAKVIRKEMSFQSNNKLHASKHTTAAVDDTTVAYSQPSGCGGGCLTTRFAHYEVRQAPIAKPDMAYETWRCASTVVGLTTQQKLLVACLDTSCVMAIIDADLPTVTPVS
ncbi:hypothetical protein EN45_101250 [Penicillium chrysogenum]|uniref:Uncharacterized protein n=2 Tax=Penicillium chrysogenum species complex TaxID=254878 RepID=B6HS73_PENRW|nr:uncharacterized protein N7525_005827 [Penicillium rubens]KAJ5043535.1 hypothetical protein NUH16_000324 [Penicillium rubens]KAJ5840639.1 hypothetical protein N7525_005827 [Penicillium rubens]KZN85929.1 hypothetical protein EN45_101250 [Penicillium chrysogenum]CAP97676.1 hypothetical protein PCH_Pc22g03880 [Penicillium rubens Wisconsin 54-1255]